MQDTPTRDVNNRKQGIRVMTDSEITLVIAENRKTVMKATKTKFSRNKSLRGGVIEEMKSTKRGSRTDARDIERQHVLYGRLIDSWYGVHQGL